jgi:hypothetical protein
MGDPSSCCSTTSGREIAYNDDNGDLARLAHHRRVMPGTYVVGLRQLGERQPGADGMLSSATSRRSERVPTETSRCGPPLRGAALHAGLAKDAVPVGLTDHPSPPPQATRAAARGREGRRDTLSPAWASQAAPGRADPSPPRPGATRGPRPRALARLRRGGRGQAAQPAPARQRDDARGSPASRIGPQVCLGVALPLGRTSPARRPA